MAETTGIEWCDHTFNPWTGCTKVSRACDHCYAEAWAKRSGLVEWGNHPRRRTSANYWRQPLKWNRRAGRDGIRRKVFCASLADVFDNQADPAWRCDLWGLISETPNLDWLLLTKRPQNIEKMLPRKKDGAIADWSNGWPNVWLGTTVENQEEADRRIPHLLATPAAVRFLSCEPLLGEIDLRCVYHDKSITDALDGITEIGVVDAGDRLVAVNPKYKNHGKIDWVIAGGESGPGARPMHPAWVRSVRDQCVTAGISFFFKQWGEFLPEDDAYARDLKVIETGPAPNGMYRVGKRRAGAMLDGREWRQMPVDQAVVPAHA